MIIHTRIRYSIFSIIPLILLILLPAVSFADADRIFKENSKAVVVVIAYDEKGNAISQGSGFIVRADGAVVTNYHVISKARDIKVKIGDKVLDVEGLIFTDKENNLVILKAKAKDMPVVKLGDIEERTPFRDVYVISSFEGLENTICHFTLFREIMPGWKIRRMFTFNFSSPVSSGGPVLNIRGEVIGVSTVFKEDRYEFAISVDLIKDKISSKKVTAIKKEGLEDYEKTTGYWIALYSLGLNYQQSGMYKEAIEEFKKVIRIKPDYADAHYSLGGAYMKLDMYKEAIEAYKQVIRIDPDNVSAHSNLGEIYKKLDMHKEAIEAFKQVIRINPDDALTHRGIGLKYMELGMYKEAIEVYKQVIRTNPDDALAHYSLGLAYHGSGMYKEAIEIFKQVIKTNPDDATAHSNLGLTYYALGMYKEAIEAYKQAIRIEPDNALAHNGLGEVYLRLGLGAGYMIEPFQSGPTSVNAGNVYISKDSRVYHHDRNCTNLSTTDNLMEFTSSQDAKNAGGIPCNYCDSSVVRIELSGQGMYKEAIEAFKQAIRIDPDNAYAHCNLGIAYSYSGMYKEGIDALKQATRIKPDYARAHYCLGLFYFSLNDRGSALEQYKILKNLDSELANKLFNSIYE